MPYRLNTVGIHQVLYGLTAVALLASCGDPVTVGSDRGAAAETTDSSRATSPASTNTGVASSDLALCTAAPFDGAAGEQPQEAVASQAASLVDAHPELFAGMWWDGSAGESVFATVDVNESTTLIKRDLAGDLPYRIQVVGRNASQLAVLQQRVGDLRQYGVEPSSLQRVWDALVEIDLPILDESSLEAVRQVFADDLDAICVTGADPSTVPADGPQPKSGDGWRLLADQTGRGEPFSTHVAVNATEYESLWASLALDGEPPAVDFATEIVVHFGAVYSGSCPEIRLDDVNIDLDRSLVTADVVQLGGNRVCTADANPRAYLVAVAKAYLPPLPFTVSLRPDCSICTHQAITTFDGTESPPAALSEYDRVQIFAAAMVSRALSEGGFDTVDVVEVVGHVAPDGFVDLEGGVELTEAERNAISQALGSRTIRFVPIPAFDQLVPGSRHAVLSLAEPAVVAGRLTITTALWCGNLCGTGGAYAVERVDGGTWVVTEPVGPQWEA